MKKVALRSAVLILSTLWSVAAPAADAAAPFVAEREKQEKIYRSEGEQTVTGYTVDRSLAHYADGLASGFDRALAALGPSDRWLDIGAGEARAVLDYYTATETAPPVIRATRAAKAQAVAMSIEDRRTPLWRQTAANLGVNQIRYLADRRLREYSLEELGKFQVISDVIGGFSYSEDLSLFVQKVMSFLHVNGSFYTVLQDVQWENGQNRPHYAGAPFLTTIQDADGSEMKVCTWLKRITCAEVTCEAKPSWQPPTEAFRIRKTCDDVSVPPLKLIRFEAGTPPERRYQVQPSSTELAGRSEGVATAGK